MQEIKNRVLSHLNVICNLGNSESTTPVKYSIIFITTPFEEVFEECANVGIIRLRFESESASVKEESAEFVRNARA